MKTLFRVGLLAVLCIGAYNWLSSGAVAPVVESDAQAAIGQPMNKVGSCVIKVTTSVKSVQELAWTNCSKALPEEAFDMWNNSSTVVCVGDNDVNMTSNDAGGKCWPMCNASTVCKRDEYVARAGPSYVYVRIAAGTYADGGTNNSVTQLVAVHAGGAL